jgi:organic hydroperoxide reductase OsmC/OhrA
LRTQLKAFIDSGLDDGGHMAGKEHQYSVRVSWTGNTGSGTRTYRGYERAHDITAPGKPTIEGSADPAFRGDGGRWNPEDLLVASLSACHKLWFLALCSQAGVVVTAYEDSAEGVMLEEPNGAGQFTSVTLKPCVTISAESDEAKALELHQKAHAMCFIARSVNFPVSNEPTVRRE